MGDRMQCSMWLKRKVFKRNVHGGGFNETNVNQECGWFVLTAMSPSHRMKSEFRTAAKNPERNSSYLSL